MKLISLNTWGGKLFDPLMNFINEKSADTDIFCFQEVFLGSTPKFHKQGFRVNLGEEISRVLKDFTPYYHKVPREFDYGDDVIRDLPIAQATFVKNPFRVIDSGGFLTYKEDSNLPLIGNGNFLYTGLEIPAGKILIGNLHGLLIPNDGKGDDAKREYQTRKILDLLESKIEFRKKVLIGDFNIKPNTQAVTNFGKNMHNLIKDYNIQTTRNHHYQYMEKFHDYIADYCFVSPDSEVKDFKVLSEVVSDHQPLYLEFE